MRAPKIVEGDLVFENGDIVMVDEDEELIQSVQTILQTNKGEWFLNTDFGLDRSQLLAKRFDEALATDAIAEAIAQEERIQRIENISFQREGRSMTVNLTLTKKDGETLTIEGVTIGA
jgi:phage baseplate assembly protein W